MASTAGMIPHQPRGLQAPAVVRQILCAKTLSGNKRDQAQDQTYALQSSTFKSNNFLNLKIHILADFHLVPKMFYLCGLWYQKIWGGGRRGKYAHLV
jgi:hypothetical protein